MEEILLTMISSVQVVFNVRHILQESITCYGQSSSLTVNNSDVWNQSIETNSNGKITFTNCNIYGSQFITRSAQSTIAINGGSFRDNPPIDRTKTFVDVISGYPNYNPFCAPGPLKSQEMVALLVWV